MTFDEGVVLHNVGWLHEAEIAIVDQVSSHFREVSDERFALRARGFRSRVWATIDSALLSDKMYSIIGFRKSTSPQNRQLNILISNSEQ